MDKVLGYSAGGLLAVMATTVAALPLLLSPVLAEAVVPGAHWRGDFEWWWLWPGILLVALFGVGRDLAQAAARTLSPRPLPLRLISLAGSIAEVMILSAVYSMVLEPIDACTVAALVALLAGLALERLLPLDDPTDPADAGPTPAR